LSREQEDALGGQRRDQPLELAALERVELAVLPIAL
jgi:hypothetical protein